MNYFKILDFLQKDGSYIFSVPVDIQKAYLNKWVEPRNDMQRSYLQYRCLHSFFPTWKNVLLNFFSYFLLPIAVVYFLIRRVGIKQGAHYEAIIEKKRMPEIVPLELRKKYDIHEEGWREGMSFSFKDIVFIFKLVKASRGHLYFVLRSSLILAVYSDMIKRHSPKIIMRHAEYAFSSSLLTDYCHGFGIKHINIQHGEKLFFIRDSFFHFDECYVWDKHYVDLFISMRAEGSQFIISLPPSMQVDVEKYRDEQYYADYKYYLSAYNEEVIKSIVESMLFVKQEGKKVKYRPHPRYSDIELLKKYVSEEEIEYPPKVTILQSISNLEYAVSSYSTVLSQAYFSGKKVILDDVTYKEHFEKLSNMNYILSKKNNSTLSSKQLSQ
jgi:hypothetical protein